MANSRVQQDFRDEEETGGWAPEGSGGEVGLKYSHGCSGKEAKEMQEGRRMEESEICGWERKVKAEQKESAGPWLQRRNNSNSRKTSSKNRLLRLKRVGSLVTLESSWSTKR